MTFGSSLRGRADDRLVDVERSPAGARIGFEMLKEVGRHTPPTLRPICGAVSPDGELVMAASTDAVHVYDARSSKVVGTVPAVRTAASDYVDALAHAGSSMTIIASSCYDTRMKKRPGGTTHLSISLPTEEAKLIKRRAKRIYGGNVSRVVSDAVRYIAYEEGRDALIASFGGKGRPTAVEAKKLDAEWGIEAKKSA